MKPVSDRARRALWLVMGMLLVSVGAHLAEGLWTGRIDEFSSAPSTGDRLPWGYEELPHELEAVAGLLRRFRDEHGRYPTHDEGLAVLAEYAKPLGRDPVFSTWPGEENAYLIVEREGPADMVERAEMCGSPPPTDAELAAEAPNWVPDGKGSAPTGWRRYPGPAREQLPIGTLQTWQLGRERLLVTGGRGLVCPSGIPYVYENRTIAPGEAFADSPVELDRRGWFSVKVDEGVYVWSVGGKGFIEERDLMPLAQTPEPQPREFTRPRIAGLVGIGIGVVIVAIAVRTSIRWLFVGLGGLAVAFLMTLLPPGMLSMRTGCYIAMQVSLQRTPQLCEQRRQILDRYLVEGLISQETYDLTAATLQPLTPITPPTSQPATQPSSKGN